MKRHEQWSVWLITILATCGVANGANVVDTSRDTTASVVAIANLDQQITQSRDEPGVEELLLVRSRFLGDYEALDRASMLSEPRLETAHDLFRSAQTHSASL